MDRSVAARIFSKIVVAIVVLALADLVFLNWWVIKNENLKIKNGNLTDRKIEKGFASSPSPETSPSPSVSFEPKPEAETVETKTVVERETQTIVQTSQKEIFIPIGTGLTRKNSYEDLAGLEVAINTNKYADIESVVFEASIWVQDGNGKAWAQLYNKTDGHPVWNSEISTSSAKGVLATSPKIALSDGNKTYRVQAKTDLTDFAAHVENARVKITLK